MKNTAQQTAQYLLDISAVQFNFKQPFRWSSGWLSPIYCDCRLTLSYPKIRNFITDAFVDTIKNQFPDAQAIAGVATAGIPQAALIAQKLDLPMLYIRAKAKEHGKENLIEGKIEKGQKTIVIEDIISTGGSSLNAIKALQEAETEVLSTLAILSYGFEMAHQQFKDQNINLNTLSDYTYLIQEFSKKEDLSEEIMASLYEWRKNPQDWKGI